MTAKIEWYREVLELEPNSKVFFPLARLEAERGQTAEAISLLEKGLDRHPEYLEARLFLIELLYQSGQREHCNAEVAKLDKMFASYAGFWQAWAACLASEEGQSDTASIIRFLAAHFVAGPVNFRDVINRGLDSILREGSGDAAASLQADAAANFVANQDAMLEDLDSALAETFQTSPEDKLAAHAQPESAVADEDTDAAMLPAEEMTPPEEDLATAMDMPEDSMIPEEEMPADIPSAAETAAENEPESAAEGMPETAAAQAMPEREEPAGAIIEAATDNAPSAVSMTDAAETESVEAEAVVNGENLAIGEDDASAMLPAEEPQEAEVSMPETEVMETGDIADESVNEETGSEITQMAEELAIESDDPDADLLPQPDGASALEEAVADIAAMENVSGDMAATAEKITQAAKTEPASISDASERAATAGAEMLASMELPEMTDEDKAELDEFGEEEPFSLRTRSMAEVLAEQGDIQGSLDIYQELAAAATSSDEAEDINSRIATLRARLTVANASSSFKAEDTEAAARSKEKLIGMLEALAERVEARAQTVS